MSASARAHIGSTETGYLAEDYEEIVANQAACGFAVINHAPGNSAIRTGARVRNRGEQYPAAYDNGTATVAAVMRRGTDLQPDSWERSYGRPNVEIVVVHDRGYVKSWSDYGTVLVEAADGRVS